jgi:hypothetical protein
MKKNKTIIGRIAEYQHYNGGSLEQDILDLIDGVSYCRRTYNPTNQRVPALQDTTVEIKNISSEYIYKHTGCKVSVPHILQSRAHIQGEIYWGTVNTYHPKGTVLGTQERVQVPRRVRNTRKPHYLAIKNNKYYYPNTGTGILKRRRHALRTGKLVGSPRQYGFPVHQQQLTTEKTQRGLFADSDDEE